LLSLLIFFFLSLCCLSLASYDKLLVGKIYTCGLCYVNRWRHSNNVIQKMLHVFRIKLPTKRIFRIV